MFPLPGFQFIITTRPKYLDVHKVDVDYTYIHLEHFNREQRVQWLENYIHVCGERVSDFIEDYIRNLADWDDSGCMENSDDAAVCDTPMTLYMIAAKRISRDSLTNHWALYRQFFFQELSAISDRCYALCTYWKADTRKGFVEFYHNNIRFFFCVREYTEG